MFSKQYFVSGDILQNAFQENFKWVQKKGESRVGEILEKIFFPFEFNLILWSFLHILIKIIAVFQNKKNGGNNLNWKRRRRKSIRFSTQKESFLSKMKRNHQMINILLFYVFISWEAFYFIQETQPSISFSGKLSGSRLRLKSSLHHQIREKEWHSRLLPLVPNLQISQGKKLLTPKGKKIIWD